MGPLSELRTYNNLSKRGIPSCNLHKWSSLIPSVDFDNADALLISEVKMLLEHRKAQHESSEEDTELSNVFLKTLEHCQTFSKYNSRETIAAVRT